jgi:small subunit ribosomal protein S17
MIYIGRRKVLTGQVLSNKMVKTVVVGVEVVKRHRLYGKAIKRIKKYKVDDGDSICNVGDKVQILETRPISKEKRWRVLEIISKGQAVRMEQLKEK